MNRRTLIATACFVAALAAPGALRAQLPPAPPPDPDAIHWSLDDCLRIALENNLDLVSSRKDPMIAEQGILGAESRFDSQLRSELNYNRGRVKSTFSDNSSGNPAITAPPTTSDNIGASIQWAGLMDFGANWFARLDLTDNTNTSRRISQDSTGQFLLTSTSAGNRQGLTLHWDMPLLKGFGRVPTTAAVLLSRSGLESSREGLRLNATLTTQQVENAYWDLVATHAALRVAAESLKLAQDLLVLNKKKVEVGTLAPIEITQAEAGVASKEEDVIVAETNVRNAEDELRRLLAIPANDPSWEKPIEPTDKPQFENRTVDVEATLATALEHRPELAIAKRRLSDEELNERVAHNAVKHSLNMVAELTPTQSNADLETQGASTRTEDANRDWLVGLVYTIPIGNRQAKSDYAVAVLTREKRDVELQNQTQTIRVDVRRAARNVESGVKRVAAARSNTALQRKTVEAEQKKFDNGMSTTFEVLRIQTDLTNAQFSEINAILAYTKALADLERAKGTLLEARGLQIQ